MHSSEDFVLYARTALDRLRLRIASQPIRLDGCMLNMTASIGMSFFDRKFPKTQEQLIKEADEAVYISKRSGKNRVTLYGNETPPPIIEKMDPSQAVVPATAPLAQAQARL